MQQDKHLQTRMTPPKMDHLAEQIIARSKVMEQETATSKAWGFANIFKLPQMSYALAAACCVLLLTFVITQNIPTESQSNTYEVADQDWDEFWNNEEETMFAGL